MNRIKLILKSILYYWKINVASVLTAALCVAIITGALIIGDSVKYSLNQITDQRLGKTTHVLNSGDKLFRQQLAGSMSQELQVHTSPVFQATGMASKNGGEITVNNVQVNGIDTSFFKLSPSNVSLDYLASDEVYVNTKLAQKLQLSEGDFLLLKIRKHDDVPLNSPFISTERRFVSLFATIKGILNDEQFGRFNLRNEQVSPYNVFLNIHQLNGLMETENAANLILFENAENSSIERLQQVLKNTWELSDASLSVEKIEDQNKYEIQSDRIFFDRTIIKSANRVFDSTDLIFTYLVNGIEHNKKVTPYSFVSAIQSLQLSENEIIINQWLADDLDVAEKDTVILNYYIVGPLRRITEESKVFVVKDIVGFTGFAADKTLMPSFPGLANVDNCRDWNTGVSIDLDKIRNKDEEYWDTYGGTPKAFISIEASKEMWANEFGEATAIRIISNQNEADSIGATLLKALQPVDMGLQFIPVREQGKTAAGNSVDFSQLFLGMSFFIVVAALLLISLFFHLNTQYRSKEMGFYLAAGFTKKYIRRLLLTEGSIIVLLGGLIGLAGAVGYNKILLNAMNTVWMDMVKTNILFVKVYPASLAIGYFSGVICAMLSLYFSVKSKLGKSVVELQKNVGFSLSVIKSGRNRPVNIVFYISVIMVIVFTGLYLLGLVPDVSLVFFVYGLLLLVISISGFNLILNARAVDISSYNLSFTRLCLANLSKNKKRSLLIVSMLAIGVYLVISTGANRQYMIIDENNPKSGTGGFLFYAKTTLPVIHDLNIPANKTKYGIEKADSFDVNLLQLKTLEGDEASCFNLNQIQKPRLLGVDYKKLAEKKAFSFANSMDGVDADNPWNALEMSFGENSYPVIADQTVIKWSFGKKVGDTLFFQAENGGTVNLILVAGLQNSIFQGNLLIADSVFRMLYPSVPGSKVFLIDGDADTKEEIKQLFYRNFRDYGIEITDASERLISFYSVQNTYLNVFVLLGGIGLIIGTLGIGILIFRSVLERKMELGILRAIGFNKLKVLKMFLYENSLLLLAGITAGSLSAMLSTLPSFLESGAKIPINLIVALLFVLVLFGMGVVFISVVLSLKRNLMDVLKSE